MQLKVGDIVEGKVSGITKFGAFVDIGEGKSGMVHISEISRTYVNDIHDVLKENDAVKVKVLGVNDEGKISLSIKRAEETERKSDTVKKDKKPYRPSKPDNSFTWTSKKSEPTSFEEMMNRFKQTSDEKFSDLKRKNPEPRRPKRGSDFMR